MDLTQEYAIKRADKLIKVLIEHPLKQLAFIILNAVLILPLLSNTEVLAPFLSLLILITVLALALRFEETLSLKKQHKHLIGLLYVALVGLAGMDFFIIPLVGLHTIKLILEII